MNKVPLMKSEVGFSSRVNFHIGVERPTPSLTVTCRAGNQEKSLEEILFVDITSKEI